MRFGIWGVVALLTVVHVNGLECEKNDILKKYRLGSNHVSGVVDRDTPPSKTSEEWWINPCEENKASVPSGCNEKDMLCGLTQVSLPGKDPLLTQIIDFSKDISNSIEESGDKLLITLKGTNWGSNSIDAYISFQCDNNMKSDEILSTTWQRNEIQLAVKGPSGCLKDKKDNDDSRDGGDDNHNGKDDDKGKDKKKGSTSWFTWLLLYALLFTFIYLIVTSYINTRGGSFQDFREEFIERSTQLVTSLPAFGKEVVAKLFGNESSQRGGYSAV